MSTDCVPPESREDGESRRPFCRVPNCWRHAAAVRIAGETVREAILCKRHRDGYFGVSS